MSIDTLQASAFPKFKQLSWEDKPFFELVTRKFEPYSDFNFLSLWSYCNLECFWSHREGNIIVKFVDYIDKKEFLSFIGTNNIPSLIIDLFSLLKNQNAQPILKLVPELSIQHAFQTSSSGFQVYEDVDNHDYVLDLRRIADMRGNFYLSKRHELNRFKNFHKQYFVKKDNLSSIDNLSEVTSIFLDWAKSSGDVSYKNELNALEIALASNSPDTHLYRLYVENDPVAFAIIELVDQDYAMLHYWKATARSPHAYTHILHHIAKDLSSTELKYLNIQQDLGHSHLRHAKMRWHPTKILKKYVISPAPKS